MNILIVDDREENVYLLETLLKANGHDVLSAPNGSEALEKIKADGIDLIISDILMPVMDGFQLCRKIKTDKTLCHIPFIIYTATYTGPQDEEFAKKIGADRFIQKPCEPDVFMDVVRDEMAAAVRRDIASTPESVGEEEMLKLYSERLVRKLEQKMLELEKEVRVRQETEEILRASEQKYRLLADNTLDIIWAMDMDLAFTYVNPAIRTLMGFSPEEWIGTHLSEHCDEENFAKMVRVIVDEKAKGPDSSGVILETILLNKNREPIPFEIHGKVNYDEKGEPAGLQGVAREISERKQAEKILRESEGKYRTLLENLPQKIFHKDKHSVYVACNENYARDLKIKAVEIKGKTDYEFFPEELAKKYVKDDETIIASGKTEEFEERYVIDKKETWIHTTKTPVRDERNNITGILGIFWDISEQKLLAEQLRQSQKLEAVGMLTSGIAHDFNNLLTSIIGNAELILMGTGKNDSLREMVEEIKGAGERASNLTHQLLAFSRKQILQPEVINLNEIVNQMKKMLNRIIPESIELRTHPAPDLGQVEVDVGQMEQVIMNLTINAKDAMLGGGRLTIETKNVELDEEYAKGHAAVKPGPYVMLAVSDTGTGMTKEVQSQLFQPFFTTKGKGEGTGLGLSMVYGIVKQSNGNIWVYSEPGKGTTFRIYLPRADKDALEKRKAKEGKLHLQGSETILVVEDDASIRKMALKSLEKYGYTVLLASDGEEALRISEGHKGPIHLMVTDVVMPGMSGKELADRLKTPKPDMKVLFMSGYTNNAIVHHGVLDKNIAFLQKPFTPEDLARKVKEVLNMSEMAELKG